MPPIGPLPASSQRLSVSKIGLPQASHSEVSAAPKSSPNGVSSSVLVGPFSTAACAALLGDFGLLSDDCGCVRGARHRQGGRAPLYRPAHPRRPAGAGCIVSNGRHLLDPAGLPASFLPANLARARWAAAARLRRPSSSAWPAVTRRPPSSRAMITVEQRRRWRLRVIVRRASTGLPVGTVTWSGIGSKPLISNLQRNAGQWVASLLQRTGGPTAEPPGGDGGRAGRRWPRTTTSPRIPIGRWPRTTRTPGSPAACRLGAAGPGQRRRRPGPSPWGHVSSRGPSCSPTTSRQLPGYNLPGAPALAGEVEFFPAVRSSGIAQEHRLRRLLRELHRRQDPAKRRRHRAPPWPGPTGSVPATGFPSTTSAVLLGTDYTQHYFNLDVDNALPPNVNYSAIRPSLAGRVPDGPQAGPGPARRPTCTSCRWARWPRRRRFPQPHHARRRGCGARVSYHLDNELDVTAGVDMRYYAHTMNAQPGDPANRLVGGAIDAHFGASMMLTYRLR